MKRFRIHGARGTRPVCGRRFLGYGGQTTCFSLQTNRGLIVVDAGTGLAALSASLHARARLPPITILFTHLHLDHVCGLPGFQPLYRAGARITLLAARGGWQRALRRLIAPPFWPLRLAELPARIACRGLPAGRSALRLYGARVAWCPLHHPQGCLAYRLEYGGRAVVIATDREPCPPGLERRFRRLCRGADVLVLDAQYTPRELAARRGWGHGAWTEGAALARAARVGELILTHHDPRRSDAAIRELVRRARRVFPRTRAARAGLAL